MGIPICHVSLLFKYLDTSVYYPLVFDITAYTLQRASRTFELISQQIALSLAEQRHTTALKAK